MAKQLIGVTLKWLEGDDLDQLEPIMRQRGWMALNKQTSRALAAFDDTGKLIGFSVLQLVPHTEPLYVDKEWRGSHLAEELSDQMVAFLGSIDARGFVFMSGNPFTEKIAARYNMKKIDTSLLVKINEGNGL